MTIPLAHKIKNCYLQELIYYPEYMPKEGDLNQCCFPYCKQILQTEQLIDLLKGTGITPMTAAITIQTLLKKDKLAFKEAILATGLPGAEIFDKLNPIYFN